LSAPAIQAALALPSEQAAITLQAAVDQALRDPSFSLENKPTSGNYVPGQPGLVQVDGQAAGDDSSDDDDDEEDDDDDIDDSGDDRDDDKEDEQEEEGQDEVRFISNVIKRLSSKSKNIIMRFFVCL